MGETEATEPAGYLKESAMTPDHSMVSMLKEWDAFTAQRDKRKSMLASMESASGSKGKVAVLGFFCMEGVRGASIDADDIPALGDALKSLGDVDVLYLVINSPGGDGTIAEKMIEMCRHYCDSFRVAVPNRAKSAATMVALGADEIVMGYPSELGPIDPQVWVTSSGVPQLIPAQAFVDAQKGLEDRHKALVAAGEDATAILQQLASLDPTYITYCRSLADFSCDMATKYLERYMFKALPKKKRDATIAKVLERLSARSQTRVHARLIDAHQAKTDLGLKVRILPKDDAFWRLLWDYYVRADIAMRHAGTAKLIETKHDMLVKGATA